jgi:hypothetical protein
MDYSEASALDPIDSLSGYSRATEKQQEKTFLGHPIGLFVLFFTESSYGGATLSWRQVRGKLFPWMPVLRDFEPVP